MCVWYSRKNFQITYTVRNIHMSEHIYNVLNLIPDRRKCSMTMTIYIKHRKVHVIQGYQLQNNSLAIDNSLGFSVGNPFTLDLWSQNKHVQFLSINKMVYFNYYPTSIVFLIQMGNTIILSINKKVLFQFLSNSKKECRTTHWYINYQCG